MSPEQTKEILERLERLEAGQRTIRQTLDAIAAGRLGPLDWIEQRPLADGPRAFQDIDAGRTAADAYLVEVVSLLPSPDEGVCVRAVSA